jgi:pectin methylesterase-like acyl-CoA thioesterase
MACGLVLAAFGVARVEAATSWTVDSAGSGDFTTIQDAVDTAASGDAITVMAGTYTDDDADSAVVSINGLDLSIVADGVVVIDGEDAARGIYSTDSDDREDVSRDGSVDVEDLLAILQQWGACE